LIAVYNPTIQERTVNTLEAIATRRSIRRFEQRPVPHALVEQVLAATVQVPSGKNAQPWRFMVLEGEHYQTLVRLMQAKADALQAQGADIGSLAQMAHSMSAAPVWQRAIVTLASAAYAVRPCGSPSRDERGGLREGPV